jgi:hypothetical protein
VALTARLESRALSKQNQNWSFSANCKALEKKKGRIAALKRCDTQNQNFPATSEGVG